MDELNYFEHEPNSECNMTQYAALINYLASIGSTDAETIKNLTLFSNRDHNPTPAWKILIKIITPENDADFDNHKMQIKSFLYCMNVVAYDLKFINELKEMFGYREAFECHRRAVNRFLVNKCIEWSVAPFIMDAVVLSDHRKSLYCE